mgnify:CR=1 FL=1
MESLLPFVPMLVAALGGLCALLATLAVGAAAFVFLRRSGALSGGSSAGQVAAVQQMYTDRLGYRSVPTDDPAATHLVRSLHGIEVHLTSHTQAGGLGTTVDYAWRSPSPSGLSVQVVEQRVADTRKRLARDARLNRSTTFTPQWPDAFPTGSPALDARFRVYAPDARRAAEVVALEDALLACAHVELTAGPDGITLSDPYQDGLLEWMGGPMGMARVLSPAGIEVQVRLHEAAAALLLACARR